MPDIWMDVDTAVTVPCNIVPLVDATDGKTLEVAIAYNEAGMNLSWNFVTCAGVMTTTAITPTTGGDYDWTESGTDEGMYKIEIPATGGASANNDTEGFGWISGTTGSCLPFRGPTIGFRAAGLNDLLIESAYSTTRGLTGTAVPAVAGGAVGGIVLGSAANNLAVDAAGKVAVPDTQKVDLETIKTRAITCGASVTVRADVGAAAAPGAANGMLIGGLNEATTFATLSVTGQMDAGNLLIDGTTVFTGNTSIGGTFGITGAATLASFSITGQLDAGNILVDTTTALTGAVTAPTGIAANITGNITGNLSGTTGGDAVGTDFTATQKASITAAVPTAAAIGTDTASKILVTPAQKIVTNVSGQVDANVQSINDVALTGDGSALDPWGPA